MNEIKTNLPWDVIGSLVQNIADVKEDFNDADFMTFENSNLEKRLEICTTPEEKLAEYNASANRVADIHKRKTVCSAVLTGTKIVGLTIIGVGLVMTAKEMYKSSI